MAGRTKNRKIRKPGTDGTFPGFYIQNGNPEAGTNGKHGDRKQTERSPVFVARNPGNVPSVPGFWLDAQTKSGYDVHEMAVLPRLRSVFQFIGAVKTHVRVILTSSLLILAVGLAQTFGPAGHTLLYGAAYAAIIVIGLFVAFYRAWNDQRLEKEKAISEKREAVLDAADHDKTTAQIRFTYEKNCACVYVKNTGVIADFFASLTATGYIEDAHARWAHTNDVRTRIPSGIERKLLLAKLHHTFGTITTSQWEIFFNRDGVGIGSTRPTYSSVVGHPDAQAPDIGLEVIVASDPDLDGGIHPKRIILHSNRAEEHSDHD